VSFEVEIEKLWIPATLLLRLLEQTNTTVDAALAIVSSSSVTIKVSFVFEDA
jgi:hypothetical protein